LLKIVRPFQFIEKLVCYAALVCLALLPVFEALLRLFFHTGVPASAPLIIHLLLVVGILSGMITTKEGSHLSIGLVQYIKNTKVKNAVDGVSSFLSALIATIIAWCAFSFIKLGLSPWKMIGFIPDQIFAAVMPIGYAVIAFRFARFSISDKTKRPLLRGVKTAAPLILGSLCSLPVIFKIIYGFDTPDFAYNAGEYFFTLAYYLKTPVVIFLLAAALCGTPLFIVIGGLALILIQASYGEIDVTANQIYTGLTGNSIVAIPLFTLTGFFLSESRAGTRLMNLFKAFTGWIPGGMIFATVVICAFFTSFTGASGVTILALGGILYTALSEKAGYKPAFSIGVLTASGSIGLLFPPSLPIILVGSTSQTNILHLFLGGIIPGLILIAVMTVFSIIITVKNKIPRERFQVKNAALSLKASLPEVFLPLFLIAGYFSGILSLVEIGGAAVVYVLIVEVFVFHDIKINEIPKVFSKAIPIIGGILSILAISQALSYYIVDTQAPENFARWMRDAIHSKVVFLLILNLALLLVGCLIDIFSAILIVLPLIMPLGAAYGIDPVHLGIIFLVNMEAGYLTPPVGLNLFLASYCFKKPFVEICKCVVPFLLIQLAVVLLVTYVPALTTFLPKFFWRN
jgi:tripartite ATP-independent transporter DctM subunit